MDKFHIEMLRYTDHLRALHKLKKRKRMKEIELKRRIYAVARENDDKR